MYPFGVIAIAPIVAVIIMDASRLRAATLEFPSGASQTRNSYTEFISANRSHIVPVGEIGSLKPSEIYGLEISASSAADWRTLARELTNVVWLKFTDDSVIPTIDTFRAITNYHGLRYLQIQCRMAEAPPGEMSFLETLNRLRYLGIDMPKATNLPPSLYAATNLEELFLITGSVRLPDGIARLHGLQRLRIWGRRQNPILRLPRDISTLGVKTLELASVVNLDSSLPSLPSECVELRAIKCELTSVPKAWAFASKLELLDLSFNRIADFPTNLLAMPSLKWVALDANAMSSIPALIIPPESNLKITVFGNPIQSIAPESQHLLKHGVIQY